MKQMTMVGMVLALFASGVAAQEAEKPKVLKGILKFDPKLEGGVWTLKFDGTVYDLHGDLSSCASGDTVEIEGKACPGRACIHMVGIVFTVAKIKVIEGKEKRTPRIGLEELPR